MYVMNDFVLIMKMKKDKQTLSKKLVIAIRVLLPLCENPSTATVFYQPTRLIFNDILDFRGILNTYHSLRQINFKSYVIENGVHLFWNPSFPLRKSSLFYG